MHLPVPNKKPRPHALLLAAPLLLLVACSATLPPSTPPPAQQEHRALPPVPASLRSSAQPPSVREKFSDRVSRNIERWEKRLMEPLEP